MPEQQQTYFAWQEHQKTPECSHCTSQGGSISPDGAFSMPYQQETEVMTAELAMQHCLAICGMAPVDMKHVEPGKPGWRKA